MRILFKGGLVLDGTGGAPFTGDVLAEDGRIAAVGPGLCAEADETVDCAGLAVAPGFIDAHSHND